MVIVLTFWGNALSPKSETFNFPWESRSRFSGYTRKFNIKNTIVVMDTNSIIKDFRSPLNHGGTLPYYGNVKLHQWVVESIFLIHSQKAYHGEPGQ